MDPHKSVTCIMRGDGYGVMSKRSVSDSIYIEISRHHTVLILVSNFQRTKVSTDDGMVHF